MEHLYLNFHRFSLPNKAAVGKNGLKQESLEIDAY